MPTEATRSMCCDAKAALDATGWLCTVCGKRCAIEEVPGEASVAIKAAYLLIRKNDVHVALQMLEGRDLRGLKKMMKEWVGPPPEET